MHSGGPGGRETPVVAGRAVEGHERHSRYSGDWGGELGEVQDTLFQICDT